MKEPTSVRSRAWWCAVLVIAALGGLLRYHDLTHQIVLDDEWHSLEYAAKYDAWSLATTYYPNATSIPVNVYHRLVLVTCGWSELSIRFLSIVSSLGTLLLVPWLVARVFRAPTMGLLAGAVFACSPFWIFYGASARPYATFLALLTLAYYFLERALADSEAGAGGPARSRAWLLFGISGALAVWFHLYALPAIAGLVLLPVFRILRELRAGGFRSTAWRSLLRGCLLSFGSWTVLVLVLYAPPALHGIADKLPTAPAAHGYDLKFLHQSVELVSGARFGWLAWLSCAAAAVGLFLAAKKNRHFVVLLLLGLGSALLFTLLLEPEEYFVALVTWRYNISVFLLYIVGMAALLERLLSAVHSQLQPRLPRVPKQALAVVGVLLVAAWLIAPTPILRQLAIEPNNFRLHSAFQESYSGWDASRGYESAFAGQTAPTARNLPRFYSKLRRRDGDCRIVEYPLEKRDQDSPYYFYQLYHRCEVFAGYSRRDATGKRLDATKNSPNLRFSRLVDVEDLERLRRDQVDFIVVHRNPRAEARGSRSRRSVAETRRVLMKLQRSLGRPRYSDRRLSVFALSSPTD